MRPPANPYRWDIVDPAIFYGRRDMVGYLLERLLAGDRFAIAGGRRMGKTTLLRRLEMELRGIGLSGGMLVLPIFVEVGELCDGSLEAAYRVLTRRLGEAVQDFELDLAGEIAISGPTFADVLLRLARATRTVGHLQCVFLFDEIDRVLSAPWGGGFLASWRRLLNNTGELSRSVNAVFTGAQELYRIAQDVGSPLGNILAWLELQLFDFAETVRLIREPSGCAWPKALSTRIHTTTGGHPCLIQYLMQRVCNRDVDAWEDTLTMAEASFLREHSVLFQNWWQSFDNTAQTIYGHLADRGTSSEGEVIARYQGAKRALDVLAHTGVVRWDKNDRTINIAGTLFQGWAQNNALFHPHQGKPVGNITSDQRPFPAGGRRVATILFTDIVGSTALTAQLGDRRWLEVLDAHNRHVRASLATFRGREVKTTGDGFLALFESPATAIECASAIARGVEPLGLKVRFGLHAGEYDAVGDDVSGVAVNYAAWVMSKARGGEVLVSDTVRGLVAGSGISLGNRGAYRVKGSRERHRLFIVDRGSSA